MAYNLLREWPAVTPTAFLYQSIINLSTQTAISTYWGRVTHICVSKLIIIGSDNGLSPGLRQAIIWNNAGILLIGPLGPFKKMHLKNAKWQNGVYFVSASMS